MKKLLSLFFFLLFFALSSINSYAEENFLTYYDVTYDVSENQNTKVTLDVDLQNITSQFFAASYRVQTGFKSIKNIKAMDSGGNLKFTSRENDKGILVSFDFNKNVVGINNIQKFKITFDTSEVAKKSGNIWEVNIPGVANQTQFEEFNVYVNVPQSFGGPTIIKPKQKDIRISNNSLHFAKNDLGESGVSIAYGNNQVYEFDLTYHLHNPKLFPIKTEIAIPSNNNYQDVRIQDIYPRPDDVVIDKDGNWLASYSLLPSEDFDVVVKGKAKVLYRPRKEILTEGNKKIYLQPQKYWEKDDPKIKKLASTLQTPEKIYKYVVENLEYDSSRIKEVQIRQGGADTLSNKKSAVCLEFTDLFIALARSAGIPARAVEGYANTNNTAERPLSLLKDVLHSWPEYYDFEKNAWIMVDPTWENTTKGIDYFNVFDFDHLAFIIKGEDSLYPVPAGGYKLPGKENVKDVKIFPSENFDTSPPVLSAYTDFSEKYLAGFPIRGRVEIQNLSGVISPNQTFRVSSQKLNPGSQNIYFDKIPPFGKKSVDVSFRGTSLLTNGTDTIKIMIGKETLEANVSVSPFYKNIYFILGGLIIGSIIVILFGIARRGGRISIS